MDKNFMDKFTFIFSTIQSVMLIVGILVGFIFTAKFSGDFSDIKARVHFLELQNPITP